ncbi:MAG: hypothetical protein RQ875_09820 [Vicingaceae bacterium]|nr:hypothetical protein [Vicingaceae bacterium]
MMIKNRLQYYLLLVGLSLIMPYVITFVFIVATGNRVEGMQKAIIPAIIAVHFLFGLIFIKKNFLQKVGVSIFLSVLICGIVWLLALNDIMIKTEFDLYGFWDLAITNLFVGLIVWELFYQIKKR